MNNEQKEWILSFRKTTENKLLALNITQGSIDPLIFQMQLLQAHGNLKFAERIATLQREVQIFQDLEKRNAERIWLLKEELKLYDSYLEDLPLYRSKAA